MSTFGEYVRQRRLAVGLTQARLAELTDYSVVMISKIESGVRCPPPDDLERLAKMSRALNAPVKVLRRYATTFGSQKAPKRLAIMDAAAIARENKVRSKDLRAKVDKALERARSADGELEVARATVTEGLLEPFEQMAKRMTGYEGPSLLPSERGEPRTALADAVQGKIQAFDGENRGIVGSVVGLASAGAGGGAVAGAAIASGAYAAVAAFGTASTGTAIATLSGIAATNATLAWLGGGTLAAGGLGVAGGTAVLAGVVIAPIAIVGAAVTLTQGHRIKAKQEQRSEELDALSRVAEKNDAVIEQYSDRAQRVSTSLKFAAIRGRALARRVDLAGGLGDLAWGALSGEQQRYFVALAHLLVPVVALLRLPFGLMPRTEGRELVRVNVAEDVVDSGELDARTPEANEFLEEAIRLAEEQIAASGV